MPVVQLDDPADFAGWRRGVRGLLHAGVPPEAAHFAVGGAGDLFAGEEMVASGPMLTVPRSLATLAEMVIQHADPARFALLYRLFWRAHRGGRDVLADAADADVARARGMAQAVRRERHKMRAFLRFRAVPTPDGAHHVGWFEPVHHILAGNADFFVRRFAGMRWSILTPARSAHWDGAGLTFGAGARRADVPDDDALAAYWQVYFAAIFNPARLKVGAMQSEMPKKYWRVMPEAASIPGLIAGAAARTQAMMDRPVLSPPLPVRARAAMRPNAPLAMARRDIAACTACPLHAPATQAVFGAGPDDAAIMLVGEMPGDEEDLGGAPMIGAAGRLLGRALAEAGIDRASVYVTDAVKHFRFRRAGGRRVRVAPDAQAVAACRAWLDAERAAVAPRVVVTLGRVAAAAVLGGAEDWARGRAVRTERGIVLTTVHPAGLLGGADAAGWAAFVGDLRAAGRHASVR